MLAFRFTSTDTTYFLGAHRLGNTLQRKVTGKNRTFGAKSKSSISDSALYGIYFGSMRSGSTNANTFHFNQKLLIQSRQKNRRLFDPLLNENAINIVRKYLSESTKTKLFAIEEISGDVSRAKWRSRGFSGRESLHATKTETKTFLGDENYQFCWLGIIVAEEWGRRRERKRKKVVFCWAWTGNRIERAAYCTCVQAFSAAEFQSEFSAVIAAGVAWRPLAPCRA